MKELYEKDLELFINKQFEINKINSSYKEIKEFPEINWAPWFLYYETTKEKEKEFVLFLENYLKNKKYPKEIIHRFIGWFILSYWLFTKNDK